MIKKAAKIITIIFHPAILPTLGFILLFNSGFYFSYISVEGKRFVLLVVFFTTAVLPLLSIALLALSPGFDISMKNARDRMLALLFSAASYYIGFMLLNKVKAFPVFKVFMLAAVLLAVLLVIITIQWKISTQMAAIGSITGALIALSFRAGTNPAWAIILVVLVSGIIGTAILSLKKNNIWQVFAGYAAGFAMLYLLIYYV